MSSHTSGSGRRSRRASVRLFATIGAMCLLGVVRVSAQETKAHTARSFSLTPSAYGQLDGRSYPDWTVEPGTSRLEREALQVRRLRVGLDGRWRLLSFSVTVDPQDVGTEDLALLKDAWVQVRASDALRVRFGQFKIPVSREFLVSARGLDFLERSAFVSSLAADRDRGVMVSGRVAKRLSYQIGAFQGDGYGHGYRAGPTSAGRLVWELRKGLEIGGCFSAGTLAEPIDPEAVNGLDGRSASGYRFFKRLYVEGMRTRFGADAEWQRGPWRVTVEGLLARETRREQGYDRQDLAPVQGTGASATLVRHFGATARQGHQWDLAWRYEFLGFDDTGKATDFDSASRRAIDVRPRSVHAMTAGVSWRMGQWARVLGNGGVEFYPEDRVAPEAGRSGPYYTLATRIQLELPRIRWTKR